jgi:hypothetical protein
VRADRIAHYIRTARLPTAGHQATADLEVSETHLAFQALEGGALPCQVGGTEKHDARCDAVADLDADTLAVVRSDLAQDAGTRDREAERQQRGTTQVTPCVCTARVPSVPAELR